ncbi:hypothetical protein [Rhizobium sp. BK176]|uniref:hypothetical protein n=1 Tax=Rhizobium sp. BK176 TaxID=2587071 RepID=UPI0021686FBE|nr:hypothetical protein [Rhizobium sp. BK176]MCS4088745.1 hypothetical protein [Rhizobium sp. BK176]
MGLVVDIASFRNRLNPARRFESVACPLCGTKAHGVDRGGEVAYVCDGSLTDHGKLEWSYAPEQVAIRN